MKNFLFSLFLLFAIPLYMSSQTGFREYFYSEEELKNFTPGWDPKEMPIKDSAIVYDTVFFFEGATNNELLKGFYAWFYEVMLPSSASANYNGFITEEMTQLKYDGNFVVKFWNGASHKYANANAKMQFDVKDNGRARLRIHSIRYNYFERDFVSLPILQTVKGIKSRVESEKQMNSDQKDSFKYGIEENRASYEKGERLEYNERFCASFHLTILKLQTSLQEFLTTYVANLKNPEKDDDW